MDFFILWEFYKGSLPFFAYTTKTFLTPGVYLHVCARICVCVHRYDEELAMAEAREKEVKSRVIQRGRPRPDPVAKKHANWK